MFPALIPALQAAGVVITAVASALLGVRGVMYAGLKIRQAVQDGKK